ncbi:MAG: hydrogenase maturation nickel metallochaperone HypA [Deltaproteobacteria bacterium]|nr:hydrogenase maturation nickel metallochaperone HypA [Deltaproteobacteria bacterium]MCB9489144.1 hydrogenase maturation nickel metallochaperone HypA [Deltaproteobacteria bacterium]
MHEMSVAVAMIERLEELVRQYGAERVTDVTVSIGAYSGIDAEALKLCFPVAAKGTHADDARLIIESVPLTLHCRSCDGLCRVDSPVPLCLWCHGADLEVVDGTELKIKSMEVI